MSKDSIIAKLKSALPALQKSFGINLLGLFGSFARGEETSASDIDLLVEFEKPISLFAYVELQQTLETLLTRKVDLVHKQTLKKMLSSYVEKDIIFIS